MLSHAKAKCQCRGTVAWRQNVTFSLLVSANTFIFSQTLNFYFYFKLPFSLFVVSKEEDEMMVAIIPSGIARKENHSNSKLSQKYSSTFFDREKPGGAERATKGSGYPTQGILPSRQNVCKLHPFSNRLNFADADAVADADAGEYCHRSKMSAMFNHFPIDPHILFFYKNVSQRKK